MRITFFLLAITISTTMQAQDQAPELITDRPDQTESSAVVPLKSLQIETGFVLEKDETLLFNQTAYTYNTTLLRYGLFNNFELRLGLEYSGENNELKSTNITNTISGFSPIHTGFKVKISDEESWKPEIAFLGGLNLPFTANDDFKPDYTAANIRFAFAHTLTENFSVGYNLGVEYDGETAVPGYFYSIALGIGITSDLGMFVENYGLIPESGTADHLFDAGFTYLITPNFQLDISGGLGINDNPIDQFISLGLSYRIPE